MEVILYEKDVEYEIIVFSPTTSDFFIYILHIPQKILVFQIKFTRLNNGVDPK